MKIKRVFALILVAVALLSLASCKTSVKNENEKNDNGNSSNSSQSTTESGVLYAPGVKLNVVYADDDIADEALDIFYDIGGNTSVPPVLSKDDSAVAEHELCHGKTNREISKKAYSLLERVESDGEYDKRYVIYSDGNSVAIVAEKWEKPEAAIKEK